MDFKLVSEYSPTGDQPQAIEQLVEGLKNGVKDQTLLGVTGSGKTFTIANVIREVNRPTLVLSHNKTLAAQLYSEFKAFFPDNAVEYFVSYYDYYQPEAYLPVTDTFIEKDLQINDEIEKLRLHTTSSLLSGRKDVIVVSSVSCIYGIGNPEEFYQGVSTIKVGGIVSRNKFLLGLVESLYSRTTAEFTRGTFRVKGDTVDIYLAYTEVALRVIFWGDEIESIETFDPINNKVVEEFQAYQIFPANIFITSKDTINNAINEIQDDMMAQTEYFKETGKHLEAKRLKSRVEYDLEMMRELGYCSGIENYSRYFDRREPGTRPFCLLDYFPKDFMMVIDESHVTIPQIRAMYGGDRARKVNLVDYGFRLQAAIDNRPLKFEEFTEIIDQTIYVSATPADYELEKSEGIVAEQIIRPTGLLDPKIYIHPSLNQIDDLLEELTVVTERGERSLVTTLTKRMAEELDKYLAKMGVRCRYIHSDVDTLERVEILADLRNGLFDVLIGVNLLREGLDLPEVSLVAILDADKEGFLRSERSLVQTVGRAARNINGKVIMYADRITNSMQKTMDETTRRRALQIKHNEDNGIVPTQIIKPQRGIIGQGKNKTGNGSYEINDEIGLAADPVVQYMSKSELELSIERVKSRMFEEAKKENFIEAAVLRDEMFSLKKLLIEKMD
jgi:excinuclease ABC subunit B